MNLLLTSGIKSINLPNFKLRRYPGYAVPVGFPLQPAQLMGPIAPPQLIMAPNGSIRSVQSVPMLAAAAAATAPTWDGEPCPVHHQGSRGS